MPDTQCNVVSNSSVLRPEVVVRPDFGRAADLGVTSSAIADTLRVATAGDYDQALIHFSHSVGKAEGNFNIGYILNEKGRKTEAEAYLTQALKLKPDLKQAETALAAIRAGETDGVLPASFKKK